MIPRVLVSIGRFALLAVLAACRPSDIVPAGTTVIALESAPAVLDPRFTTDANSSLVSALVASGLTTDDTRAEARPDLAEAWHELSPLEYSFTLRSDATFQDGGRVTPADVAATYRSVMDPALRSPKREALAGIERIDTPDDRTIVFRLRAIDAAFLEATSLGILPTRLTAGGPIPPAEVVGAGPFRVVGVLDGGGVDLAPHPTYMGGPPRLPRLRFRVVPDGVVRALELASGTVHLVQNALEPDLLPWLAAQPGLELLITPGTTFQYLGINLRDPRLADVRVRQALAFGLDREAIVHHLLRDTARVATGLLPPSHWAYEGSVARYSHDQERAARLLEESGLGTAAREQSRRFSYKTSTVELRRRIAEVFQADLSRIGLGLTVRSYDWATFYEDVRRGNFELYSLAWVGIRDPDVYFRILHSTMGPPAGNNRGGYANPRIDSLLEHARRTSDRSQRRNAYAEVQRLAAEDLPMIPLWWTDNVVVKARALHDFDPAPDGDLRSLARATLSLP